MTNETQAATTTTTEAVPAVRKLETETCSRCGGSGHYSYCQSYGTTCFKCRGAKVILTKRGAAAKKYLDGLRSKPAAELVPGDRVYNAGFSAGSFTNPAAWHTVILLRPGNRETDGGAVTVVDGVTVVTPAALVVETDGCTYHTSPEQLYRVAMNAEQKRETLRLALDYQDTLTKAGTVRKRK